MDLRDYPRPKDDTGIGVHWNAGFPAAIGLGQIRQTWLPELKAMGVKWVKISRHDGGLDLATLLLQNDIMPVVRLYRYQPNPGTLDAAALAAVKDYVAAGVRYFEFNNEPDLGVEWQNTHLPSDAVEVVARNAIVDIEAILARGGYPGIPAIAVGCKWDLVAEICRLGRRDLLAQPVWQALHNYSLNHPLDYPYDAGNQEGAAYTQEFYNRLAAETWDGNAWGGWSLDRVNQERRDHANPGATAFDDPSCWRAYERHDQLIRVQIGRSLPILATENGYVVKERQDPRYVATTPQMHMAQTLEACRAMMGTSTRFDHAPDYYFCTAFWLLGNYVLGHWAPEWEGQAWYSERWPDGRLPIIAALKAETKQARPWRGDGGQAGRAAGVVKGPTNLTMKLSRTDGWTLTTHTGSDGRYAFDDLPLEIYQVTVVESGHEQSVVLTRERPTAVANFDLTGVVITFEASIIRGTVRGGAGMTIQLARPADGFAREVAVADDGTYRFAELPAGTYVVALAGTDVAHADIQLDGRNEVVVDLAVPGWGWEVTDAGASPGFGVVRCRVIGNAGLDVRLWTAGWSGMTRRTGSKPEYGADACEFSPLGAGTYVLQPQGTETQAEVKLDGSRVAMVIFTKTSTAAARASVISGHVKGGAGRSLVLTGLEDEQTTVVAADGAYRFGSLPSGVYRVAVASTGIAQDKIVLDGHNQVTVDLEVPVATASAIFGTLTNGAGRTVRLKGPDQEAEMQADADGRYRFGKLAAGTYNVLVLDKSASGVASQKSGVVVDGANEVQVDFTLPGEASGVRWTVEDGGQGPGFSVVRCRVIGEAGVEVRLSAAGWSGISQRTGSKPEYGSDACEFAPLGAGTYLVQPVGLGATGAQAEVKLASNRVAWVRFERTEAVPQAAQSIISGTVTNGEGFPVLLKGPAGEQRVAITGGSYKFEKLAAGTYRVAVLAADGTGKEVAAYGGLTLDGTNQVAVNFELPAPAHTESRVSGHVKSGSGRKVVLTGPGGPYTTTVATDETYSFSGLAAGTYQATVQDTDPATGSTQTQSGIEVDGSNAVEVNFDLGAVGPGKTVEHYLFVGTLARSQGRFRGRLALRRPLPAGRGPR